MKNPRKLLDARKLLDEFLKNPTVESLNEFRGSVVFDCVALQLTEAINLEQGFPCKSCPISSHALGSSFCWFLSCANPISTDEKYKLSDCVVILLKFRAWMEVLEEERDEQTKIIT
jgi:hypothetical protein